jgi:phosphatidylglycerophosphate synthase
MLPSSGSRHLTSPAADRRPIAARERPAFIALAAAIARAGVSPNAISVAGMVAGVLAGAAFAATPHVDPTPARVCFALGAGLVQLRLLANMLDGMVAVNSGKTSPVGELYNDLPDRISDAAALIGLGYASGGWPEMGYIAAILAILTAYIRAVGRAAGAGSDFRGPMAKQQRMFLVTAGAVYVALAPSAWNPCWSAADERALPAAVLAVIALGSGVTCIRRAVGIAAQLRSSSP